MKRVGKMSTAAHRVRGAIIKGETYAFEPNENGTWDVICRTTPQIWHFATREEAQEFIQGLRE